MKPLIDISSWQDPNRIDYAALAESVRGVILRACYGIWKDTAFDRHYAEFTARGVPVGAYHYIIGSQSMQAQADAFNVAVGLKDMRLGCWIDVEDTRPGTRLYRQNVLDYAALQPDMGIYTSKGAWATIMGGVYLNDRKLWVAHYTTNPYPLLPTGWQSWWLWQFTSSGRLPGYPGNLDTNRFFGDDADFADWIGAEIPEEPEPEDKLFDAKVVTTPPNRLRTRYTPAGNLRPEADWLQSGAVVPVYETSGAGWYRIGYQTWASAEWMQRLDFQPPATIIDIPPLSQKDPRWKDIKLGNSNLTIGSDGCLVTNFAMVLGVTPAEFNARMKAVGGFTGARIYWQMVKKAYPDSQYLKYIECWYVPAPLNEIDALLAQGVPVMVQVDYNPKTTYIDQHWVLIIGKNGNDYIANDPIDGARISFRERYGDPARWIFRIAAYKA